MNSLNLRVSSVKTGENIKKNSEMRTAIMELPELYRKPSFQQKEFVQDFLIAKSIPEQVIFVKNICKGNNMSAEEFQFLADLFFSGPIKHPVRNQIVKLLQKSDQTMKIDVANALANSLTNLLSSVNNETSCQTLNISITSLSGCFENFPKAILCIQDQIDRVLQFVLQSLQKFCTELSVHSSPSIKNEFYLFIHNSIRFMLSCVQEFSNILSDESRIYIGSFRQLIIELMLNADMPMDIKSNSGILSAYIARIFNEYEHHVRKVAGMNHTEENNCFVLCLCVGVVNTLDVTSLMSLDAEFEIIIIKIVDIANKHSTEPSMLLSASRILFQVSKILLLFEMPERSDGRFRHILKTLVEYVFCYLEHHMDSVRHICKDLFRNIIKLEAKLKFIDLITEIFDICKNDETPNALKYIVLISVSNVLGTAIILENMPNLFTDLFKGELGNDLNANSCYENLMIANRKEVEFEKWKTIWILPLIELGQSADMLSIVEILINKAVKCDPKVGEFLVNVENKNIPLSTRFSALWTVRKNGLRSEDFQIVLKSFANQLKAVMISNNDDTKIMALRLIVETHKSTEHLSDIECEVLLRFIKYNSNCQSPAIRQRSLALISKGLVRLEISFVKVLKENNNQRQYYSSFLKTLIKMLFDNLFPGANFSRRSVSLQLLKQCIEIVLNCTEPVDEYLPNSSIVILIDALSDSYETNKAVAVSILELLSHRALSDLVSLEVIKELMTSVRPTDSLTSAYYLQYFCNHTKSVKPFKVKKSSGNFSVLFCAISWCMQILEEGLHVAQKSILLAARTNPLYGSVSTIRHLLTKVEFNSVCDNIEWRDVIKNLIRLCKDLTHVVGPVVNSSSPEGHLPNDFSEIPEYLGGEIEQIQGINYKVLRSSQNVKSETLKTTPQMVLLCAWRTVKEVSLLLGEIVLRSPIQSTLQQYDKYLVTVNQIIEIGSHFKELLSETKHRGAFEQAYVGFLKLCTRLWRVEHSELHHLPMLWLNELIEIISKDEKINEKICATRRSAGVPFMVQALITSELQVGTTRALTYCMRHLIRLCSNPEGSTESRTHALNILRALFRCTDLNEVVGEYVADGFMLAIRGHTANTWAERNSSTLLFSALITRVFGVQRTKDTEKLNIRNRMTGRIFFLRYPQLYDFFLVELEKASTAIKRNERSTNLHPLLLILSRLYPSALEGTESNLKLSSFIDFVSVCSGSPEMATRVLTAKAIVAFIPLDVMADRILKVLNYIRVNTQAQTINLNYTHGLLLQVLFMAKSCKTVDNKFASVLLIDLTNVFSILKPNPVTLKTLLDIIIEILERIDSQALSPETKQNLNFLHTAKSIYNSDFSVFYPVFRKSLFVYNLYLVYLISTESLLLFLHSCFFALKSLSNEEIETCLNIVLLILENSSKSDNILTCKCLSIEIGFVNSLGIRNRNILCNQLKSSIDLKNCLNDICERRRFYPDCTIKAYTILSRLEIPIENLTDLIIVSKQYPDEVKDAIAKCVEKYTAENKLDEQIVRTCLWFSQNLSLPWNSDSQRLSAAKIIRHISKIVLSSLSEFDIDELNKFIDIVLCLSRDDDSEVREHISETIAIYSDEPLDNISATYAPILFTKYLSSNLKSINNDGLIKLIVRGIADSHREEARINQVDGEEETDLFDKNEVNVFAEPYKTFVDCMGVFTECFSDNPDLSVYISAVRKNFVK